MPGQKGSFLLHNAIEYHDYKGFLERLNEKNVENNAYPDERNLSGLFPLQLAAREGMIAPALYLLSRHWNVDRVNTQPIFYHELLRRQTQKTPFYTALQNGHFLLAEIFLALGASKDTAQKTADDFKEKEMDFLLKNIQLTRSTLIAILFWAMQNYKKYNMINLIQSSAKKLDSLSDAFQKERRKNHRSSYLLRSS